MTNIFDGCFDISESDYMPKPHKEVYDSFQNKFNLDNNLFLFSSSQKEYLIAL